MSQVHEFGAAFWDRIAIRGADDCWLWTGPRGPRGHGQFGRKMEAGKYKTLIASRVAFELAKGPIPPGLCVCHSCDNPPCCNPGHLWLGTNADNARDAATKGRLKRSFRPIREAEAAAIAKIPIAFRRRGRTVITPEGVFASLPLAAAHYGVSKQCVHYRAKRGDAGWSFAA